VRCFPGILRASYLPIETVLERSHIVMPDESPTHRHPYRLWISLAVTIVLISVSVFYFAHFSSALANKVPAQKETPIVAGSADPTDPGDPVGPDGEVFLPDSPYWQSLLDSQGVDQSVASSSPLILPINPPSGTLAVDPIDGMKLIYIRAGNFRLGANVKIQLPGKKKQSHPTVKLDAFWISQTQVTNAMYARCVKAGACRKAIRKEINPHYYDSKYAKHPVVYVTWSDAARYCKWSGGRLPTEAQWKKAARDGGSRAYPWGNKTDISRLANVGNFHTTTTKVGKFPDGASPYGLLDMGGNVREWVQDWYASTYTLKPPYTNPTGPDNGTKRLLKSASWHDSISSAKIDAQFAHLPYSAGNNRGFRCAYPPQE